MDMANNALEMLLGCNTPEEFEGKMVELWSSFGDNFNGSYRALTLETLSGLQKFDPSFIYKLIKRWQNTDNSFFFNGVVVCFSVPDEIVDEHTMALSKAGYQWLMNAYEDKKCGLAVALIGLLSENNRAGQSEEQPGLALKCYAEAKKLGSQVGSVFWFEATENAKDSTLKGVANSDLGNQVMSGASKFSKAASATPELDDLASDMVNYLPGCMREDLQGPTDDMVAAFKDLMSSSTGKEKGEEGGSMAPNGFKMVYSSSSMDPMGNGSFGKEPSIQLENGKYASSDKLNGGSNDNKSIAAYLGRDMGSTSPVSGGRTPTPGFQNKAFSAAPGAIETLTGQGSNAAINHGNVSAAQTVAGMGLNHVTAGLKSLNGLTGMGLGGGSVAPSLQGPSVTAAASAPRPGGLAAMLHPQILQRLVVALSLRDIAAVESYVSSLEAAHGQDTTKQLLAMYLQQGNATNQDLQNGLDAVTSARLFQESEQARMRNGLVGGPGPGPGGNANFQSTAGLNIAQGVRGGNVNLAMNGNLNSKFTSGGYGPTPLPTPRGRGAGGRGNDMWNNYSQKPSVNNPPNGALNSLNIGSLTPAQIAQIINSRGGAGQGAPSNGQNGQLDATQEQYFRMVLQQQQQQNKLIQAAMISRQLGAAGNNPYGGDAAAGLLSPEVAMTLREQQAVQQMTAARMAEQHAQQIAAQRYSNIMQNPNLALMQQYQQQLAVVTENNRQMKAAALGNANNAMIEEAMRRRGPQGVNPLMGLNGGLGGRAGMPQGNMNLQPASRANNLF